MSDADFIDDERAPSTEVGEESQVEVEREALLTVLASSRPDTVVEKVAWILNNYPEARNSDITLQLHYWETFCPGDYNGSAITAQDLYKLPRLTSLARARARVQNTLKLFLADKDIRQRRGTLSEDERDEAVTAKHSSAPVYAVYMDESGKTQRQLLVGSLWILQGPETLRIATKLIEWREKTGFRDELHFKDLDEISLPYFTQAIDVVLESASALSLKYIAIQRAGVGSVPQLIPKLMYHLLVQGITHEHETGRAPLPRNLLVWKDAEEKSYDSLVLAELGDRLRNAATNQFGGRLELDVLEAADSKSNDLLQVADVFVASLNRVLNPPEPPPQVPGAKDKLAAYVIERTGVQLAEEGDDQCEDLAVRINL